MPIELLTRVEAAAEARISAKSFDRLCAAGRGPRITRLGSKFFVTRKNFDQWLEVMTTDGPQPAQPVNDVTRAMLDEAHADKLAHDRATYQAARAAWRAR